MCRVPVSADLGTGGIVRDSERQAPPGLGAACWYLAPRTYPSVGREVDHVAVLGPQLH